MLHPVEQWVVSFLFIFPFVLNLFLYLSCYCGNPTSSNRQTCFKTSWWIRTRYGFPEKKSSKKALIWAHRTPFDLACTLSGQTAVTKCFSPMYQIHLRAQSSSHSVVRLVIVSCLDHTTHNKWPHYKPNNLLFKMVRGTLYIIIKCCFLYSCKISDETTEYLTCDLDSQLQKRFPR